MNDLTNPTIALICAAGAGARAGGGIPKQYQTIAQQPMLAHTIAAFAASACVSQIFVIVAPDDAWYDELIAPHVDESVTVLRVGGTSRAQSICNALSELDGVFDDAWVMVHDAARPCVTVDLITRLYDAVLAQGTDAGGLLAIPVVDTVKMAGEPTRVKKTLARQNLWLAQTPQMFPLHVLYNAYADALIDEGAILTDDASVMERAGFDALLVAGDVRNLKVTYGDDFKLAEFWLSL